MEAWTEKSGDDRGKKVDLTTTLISPEAVDGSRPPSSRAIVDKQMSQSLRYDTLPPSFRDALAIFDENGSGDLDVGEVKRAAKTYKDFSKGNGVYALSSFPDDLQGTSVCSIGFSPCMTKTPLPIFLYMSSTTKYLYVCIAPAINKTALT